jgi:demethylspheroidene O-methyltransferase
MSDNADKPTLKTRWVMQRNAILGSLRFQRWAARTPLIRIIARRRAAAQFDLIVGFVYSQILTAFVQSGLIEFLRSEPRSTAAITAFLKVERDATERLLKAGSALRIAESPQTGLWTLGEAGAPLSANTGAMAMIRHHHLLYRDLADPMELLANGRRQETALSAYWTYAAKGDCDPAEAADYSALMAATQPMVSQQIIDAYDFSAHRRMLDIGGGSGAFVTAIAESAPDLQFGIFDLPAVISETAARIEASPLSRRVTCHGGSFKESPIPPGYDLITLVRITHDHDDDVACALLAKIHEALPTGGKLLLIEPMADSPYAQTMGDAYFGFYLWAMGSGRPRSACEICAMLEIAGFSRVETIATVLPLVTSALLAIK